ncbi:hypothetical protein CsatB_000512 [Cannabis sativa]
MLRIHARQKTLFWRILSGCLPIKSRLGGFLNTDTCCALCGDDVESDVHLFRDCHFARGLWFSCPWGPCSSGLGNLNLEDWFLWLFDTRNELMILYGACIIEHIWNCRNEVIFRGAKANMAASVKIILQRFNEFRSELLEADEPVNTPSDAPRSNLVDGCRFRVDASILDGLAGLGDVQVDAEPDEASVLLHFTAVDSVLEAELRAILSVLTWAREKERNSVFIESDSLIAVKALNSNVLPYAWADALACYARVSRVSASCVLRDVAPFVATM